MSADWTIDEVEAAIDSYLHMLGLELEGIQFKKSSVRDDTLPKLPDRSAAALEFKWCNISAVLDESGLKYLSGFRPYGHYQRLLRERVEGRLELYPDLQLKLQKSAS